MAASKKPVIAAVVLAAGSSARMGATNKLHLPIDGVPMLRGSVETLLASKVNDVVVVLGYEEKSTRTLIADLPVRLVFNKAYLSGQMTSVHCGLMALQGAYDGIVIALGDQPALNVVDIDYLIEAYMNRKDCEVVVPTYRGDRGNPIIISENCRSDILAGTRNLGCRKFIDNNPELVQMVEMPNPAVVIDLDTPQEYSDYCESRTSATTTAKSQKSAAKHVDPIRP